MKSSKNTNRLSNHLTASAAVSEVSIGGLSGCENSVALARRARLKSASLRHCQFAIIGCDCLGLLVIAEEVLLKINFAFGTSKRSHLISIDVPWHIVSDVFCDLFSSIENLYPVHRDHCLNVIDFLPTVLWPAPWRGEEDNVGSREAWNNFKKVSDNELDTILDTVDTSIVPR